MDTVKFGEHSVSRFIIGTNPFSGFSHQSAEMNERMQMWFTTAKIKETLREAEARGVNTVLARTDYHVMRTLYEYWNDGGTIQWWAQTCPDAGTQEQCIDRAARFGAKACHIHGGWMDFTFLGNEMDKVPPLVDQIRDRGMLAGVAAHNPDVIRWVVENLDVDYYMCSYYNSMSRKDRPEHREAAKEWFLPEDRQIMADLIQTLAKPVIHYKIMAAGRNDPDEAFAFAARHMRDGDAVCVGIYQEEKPGMLEEDVALLEKHLAAADTGVKTI